MATLRLSHAALRNMTARGKGAVVNVSSVAAFVCRPGNTSYYSTKAWVNCFTEGLYLELKQARSPVRVQAICPGYTVTEFHDVMGFARNQFPQACGLPSSRLWTRPSRASCAASCSWCPAGATSSSYSCSASYHVPCSMPQVRGAPRGIKSRKSARRVRAECVLL